MSRIDFRSFDGKGEIRIGHGDDCVGLTIHDVAGSRGGIVLMSKEAKRLGKALVRQAKYARQAHALRDPGLAWSGRHHAVHPDHVVGAKPWRCITCGATPEET